jgi:spermidine synthase
MSQALTPSPAALAPAASVGHVRSRALLRGVAALSGVAGLGYELVWTRLLATALGHEMVAALAVLTAFFVGVALGAATLGRAVQRSSRPELWYAGLELSIGAWAIALGLFIPRFNAVVPALLGAEPSAAYHWSVAFAATLVVLLPATAALGATLPALERMQFRASGEARVGGLYASNTAGAVVGILLTTFWLAPRWGYEKTLMGLALVNVACALVASGFARRCPAPEGAGATPAPADVLSPPHRDLWRPRGELRLFVTLFMSGLLGLGYEVLVIRVLGQVLENTVYTFAVVLAVYLLGTALGAAWVPHAASESAPLSGARSGEPEERESALRLALTSATCLLGVLALWGSRPVHAAVRALLGSGTLAAVSAELAVAALVFLPATFCMGALFTQLAQRALAGPGLGLALGANTLGAALAPLVFGVVLLPRVGMQAAFASLCLGYLLLIPRRPSAGAWVAGVAGALSLLLLLVRAPLRIVSVPAGGALLAHADGPLASVSVVSDANGDRYLKVNDRFTMGGTASTLSDQREAHLPLLWHGRPRSALFLGVGAGITFDATRDYPGLRAVGVELIPEVLDALGHFVQVPAAGAVAEQRLVAADARRFVLASDAAYDVIVADLFHPSLDGAGSLYSVEHFRAVRQRLARGGLFCQWLPLYQLDLDTLRLIARTFLEVFPSAEVHLGHHSLQQPIVALVGRAAPAPYEPGWLAARVTHPPLQRRLVGVQLNSDLALFGGFLGGTRALAAFAGDGPRNSDDWPLVTFTAPAFAYAAPEPAAERLLALLVELEPRRGGLLRGDGASSAAVAEASAPLEPASAARPSADFAQRLHAYWRARDAYLKAGFGVEPSPDVREMLARTKPALLGALQLSADFMPAYLPLLGMAEGLYRTDPEGARALLTELERAVPARPEARLLSRRLFSR